MTDETSGVRALLGIDVITIEAGTAVVRLTVRDDMVNEHGTCHGGVIFTLADTAFGLACNSHGPTTVAASATIEFLHPVSIGSTLTAAATETHRSGRSGLYDVAVVDDHDVVAAHFRGRSRTIGSESGGATDA